MLVCMEMAGEKIIHKATDDDNVGEKAYRPDEDIFNNEDRVFNWGSQQPRGLIVDQESQIRDTPWTKR